MRETETSHFWVSHFPNEDSVADYFAEVWDEADESRDHTPVSRFAGDQGETWYDHDFLEYGYSADAASVEELVGGYSYSEQWATELVRRTSEAGLSEVNMFVFISQDQINEPRSVMVGDYWLRYLGTIEYRVG